MRLLLIVTVLLGTFLATSPHLETTRRAPLQKKNVSFRSPTKYSQRVLRYDPATGSPIFYDPKPRVEVVDGQSGKYALSWIGYDATEKRVIYQRPDAVDVIVAASVSRSDSRRYVYTYQIHNLPSSGQELTSFVIQHFAGDARPAGVPKHAVAGEMSHNITRFKEGNWIFFGSTYFAQIVTPGRNAKVILSSSAPPGLVECVAAGGYQGIKGIGEELPEELESLLPGYEAWPSGYTIGPVDELKALSSAKRAEYIRQRLFEFEKLGWITRGAVEQYNRNLGEGKIEQLQQQAEKDLAEGRITTELLALLTSTKE